MKDVFVNIRMTPEMKAKLTEMANAECRSLSKQIIWMLNMGMSVPKTDEQPKVRKPSLQIPDGVSEQTWEDFKRLRAAKKAPVTERALDGIAKEAMKAGMTLEAALLECCARGWTGFKAEWVQNKHDQVAALLKPSVPYLEM